jgi:acyl dehydratase
MSEGPATRFDPKDHKVTDESRFFEDFTPGERFVLPSRTMTESRFLAPVYVGDTLYAVLEVAELKAQRTTGVLAMRTSVHNQEGTLVMEGEQKYLLRKRNAKSS